jgi:hypothetical protein
VDVAGYGGPDDLDVSPYAEAPGGVRSDHLRGSGRGRARRRWLIAVAATTAAAGAVAASLPGNSAPKLVDGLPSSLAAERLVMSGPGFVGDYTPTGRLVGRIPVPGPPVDSLVVHGQSVAFGTRGGASQAVLDRHGPPIQLDGTAVFPGPHGSTGVVGLQVPDGARRVGYVDVRGAPLARQGRPVVLSVVTTPIEGLPTGVLGTVPVVAPTAFVDFVPAVRLELYEPDRAVVLGTASVVAAADDRTAATVSCTGDGVDCRLVLLDLSTLRSRSVPAPGGYPEFAPVSGALSPDGRFAAAFVVAPDQNGNSDLRAVVVEVASGRSWLVGPAFPAAAISARAVWSGDGRWLFVHVAGADLFAQETGSKGPVGEMWPLRLQVTGLFAAT